MRKRAPLVSHAAVLGVSLGELAPGSDCKPHLSPEFVETEADFNRLKPRTAPVGDIRTSRNFLLATPESVDPARYDTVVVWCEALGQVTMAALRR